MRATLLRLIILTIIGEIPVHLAPVQSFTYDPAGNETRGSSLQNPSTTAATAVNSRSASSNALPAVLPPSTDGSSDPLAFLIKESTDTKQDQLVAQSTTTRVQHQHPNHQNYPAEPFPSASYTSLSVTTAPPAASSSNNQQQVHTASSPSSYNDSTPSYTFSTFTNSYGNQAPVFDSFPNHQSAHKNYNHNLGDSFASSTSSLNTGFIQNLTSSLFPSSQYTNGSLQLQYTLNELLNKTRQPSATFSSTVRAYPQFSNGYKPSYNLAYPTHLTQTTPVAAASSSNYLDSMNDQYNIFDYIRPNQFGFRQPNQHFVQSASSPSHYRHQSGSSAQLKNGNRNYNSMASDQLFNDNIQSSFRTASNIYNTYMPYSDSISQAPTITSEQTHIPALYSYKFPLVNKVNNGFGSTTGQSQPSSAFQYIQQQSINNQNQLDNIVYHSTPFRPSIVSPPPSTASSSSGTGNPTTSNPVQSSVASQNRRPKTEADEKSIAFASLGSSSSSIGDSKSTQTSEQLNKNSKDTSSSGRGPDDKGYTTTAVPPPSSDHEMNRHRNSSHSFMSDMSEKTNRSPDMISNGQAMLLDLYEREIDNQIRDAIYSESQNTDTLLAGANRAPWYEKSTPLYEENMVDQALASWERPVALSNHNPYLPLASSASKLRRPVHFAANPLVEALQELPTFSTTDLQPIFPAGPTYSLLTPPAGAGSFAGEKATMSSQLYPVSSQPSYSTEASETGGKFIVKANDQHHQNHLSNNAAGGGLHAILFKLHSSPLSTLLTSPLTHLYASLPKNRNNRKPAAQTSKHQSQQSHQSHLFPLSLGGLSGKQLLSALTGGGINGDHQLASDSQRVVIHNRNNQHYQQQQQHAALAAATAAANLLAAASGVEPQLSPLQASLLQSQASKLYLENQHESEGLGNLFGSGRFSAASNLLGAGPSYEGTGGALGYGLAGGGISPLIWRSLFSPAHWARKQYTSGPGSGQTVQPAATSASSQTSTPSSTTTLQPFSAASMFSLLNQGSQAPKSAQTSPTPTPPPSSTTTASTSTTTSNSQGNNNRLPLSAILGNTLASHLFSPTASPLGISGSKAQKHPKMKIKILKIPVAYYDQPTSGNVAHPTGVPSAQWQPSSMASTLLSIPCPLSHSGEQVPHTFEQHLLNQSFASGALGASFAQASPEIAAAVDAASSLPLGGSSIESPISVQGFTDMNQPNDLQVSSSNLHGRLLKLLQ